MQSEDLLVLNYDGLATKVDALYAKLKASTALRELFIRNPTRVVFGELMQGLGTPSDEQAAVSNRFLFSLFSNERFLRWSSEYGERLKTQVLQGVDESTSDEDRRNRILLHIIETDKRAIYKDFLAAMLSFGDTTILNAFGAEGSMFPTSLSRTGPGDREFVPVPTESTVDGHGGNVFSVPIVVIAVAILVLVVFPVFHPGMTRADVAAISDDLLSRIIAHSNRLRGAQSLEVGMLDVRPTLDSRRE
jgi:hypothetical protein